MVNGLLVAVGENGYGKERVLVTGSPGQTPINARRSKQNGVREGVAVQLALSLRSLE